MLNTTQLKENPTSRVIVFNALVGSPNYNLSTPSSDKDYKVFVLPSLDDLYYKHELSTTTIKDNFCDYDYKDIRLLYSLLTKGSPQYLEILFSREVLINDSLLNNDIYQQLRVISEDIVKVHIDTVFNSTIGHITKKISNTELKAAENNRANGKVFNIESRHFDLKQLHHAYRLKLLLERYFTGDFNSYQHALYFDDNEPIRQQLIDIKLGQINLEQVELYTSEVRDFLSNNSKFGKQWIEKANDLFGDLAAKYMVKNLEYTQFEYNKPVFDILKNGFDRLIRYSI